MKLLKRVSLTFIEYFGDIVTKYYVTSMIGMVVIILIATPSFAPWNETKLVQVGTAALLMISLVRFVWNLIKAMIGVTSTPLTLDNLIVKIGLSTLLFTSVGENVYSKNQLNVLNEFSQLTNTFFVKALLLVLCASVVKECFFQTLGIENQDGHIDHVGKMKSLKLKNNGPETGDTWLKKATRTMAEHEAGHTLLAYYMGYSVENVTINPSVFNSYPINPVGGCMISNGNECAIDGMVTLEHYKKYAYIDYAGMAAVQVLHGGEETPGGGENDIKSATRNLQYYLQYLFDDSGNTLLAKELINSKAQLHQIEEYQTKALISLAKQCYMETIEILSANIEILNQLSNLIEEKHSLNKEQIKEFFKDKELYKISNQQFAHIFKMKGVSNSGKRQNENS
ncbi:hypothetical protein [Breznakia pachnodae]|uniref:Peptidase M41 domain-containing protein n=1 Tax=Breznakia pachnodae TaxID=265178 RepID=A0ABU0E919_9FIRM|nr:hypothetical protein [Breznakia pachnodae]MDQ0363229.1 hypothetical protein [Breznakia pachnodae]